MLLTVTCLDCLVCVFSPCDLVCPSCCLVNLIRCVSFVPDCPVYLRSLKSANWNEWRLLAPSLWSVTRTVCTLKYQFLMSTLTSNKANIFCFLPTCLSVWWTWKERLLYGSKNCTCTSKKLHTDAFIFILESFNNTKSKRTAFILNKKIVCNKKYISLLSLFLTFNVSLLEISLKCNWAQAFEHFCIYKWFIETKKLQSSIFDLFVS